MGWSKDNCGFAAPILEAELQYEAISTSLRHIRGDMTQFTRFAMAGDGRSVEGVRQRAQLS